MMMGIEKQQQLAHRATKPNLVSRFEPGRSNRSRRRNVGSCHGTVMRDMLYWTGSAAIACPSLSKETGIVNKEPADASWKWGLQAAPCLTLMPMAQQYDSGTAVQRHSDTAASR